MDLSRIIDEFRGPLIGLIVSWGATHNDAAEIAQDSFADAYFNRDACRGDLDDPIVFGRWLRGIARNNFRNALRSRKRRESRVAYVEPTVLEVVAGNAMQHEDDRLQRLRAAVDTLPARLKQVVLMHYLDESTVKHVAALLSVPLKTVEGRLYRARRELKRIMGTKSSAPIGKALML